MASFSFRKLLFGSPLRSERAAHERLPIILALPIFASDALSSVSYATEAILRQFQQTHIRPHDIGVSLGISLAIVALVLMVVVSFREIIYAYPGGGGSYEVARENLGLFCGLLVASSLLVDYILTVAVSAAESTAATFSALHHFAPNATFDMHSLRVPISISMVLILTLLNLRGVRESGVLFAGPSYGFILCMFIMLVGGLYTLMAFGRPPNLALAGEAATHGVTLTPFLLLRGFASGCAALTGIEAVADGVQAFRKPEARNASITLIILGSILGVLFIGITFLANAFHVSPNDQETVISQIARASFGVGMPWGILYYAVQIFTALILFLAANTAFSGFPRLASILAEDGFLPRQLASVGDRLVFNNGIFALALVAIGFLVIFSGETHALLPLYTVGVFIAFTLAQAGMVRRCMKATPKQIGPLIISGLGATVTGVVLVVILYGKFIVPQTLFGILWLREGAWMALLLMGVTVWIFTAISAHYRHHEIQMAQHTEEARRRYKHTVIVLVPARIHRGVVQAAVYAQSISEDAIAVHVGFDRERVPKLKHDWEEQMGDMDLLILDSPYRSLIRPVMEYLDAADAVRDDDVITVVLPEFVPARWWHGFLHNATGWMLRLRLFYRRDVIITSVRYYLDK